MTNHANPPDAAPCWADLWTSDVESSRTFYSELFGWQAGEPSPQFGGYFFFFTRRGTPVAGAMGDAGGVHADDTWKLYVATDDVARTAATAVARGGAVLAPPAAIADLGSQAVLADPEGARIGAWQPGSFRGFAVTGEPGTACWFELLSGDPDAAAAFYQAVFGWTAGAADGGYATLRDPSGGADVAGIAEAAAVLASGEPARWTIYWEVDDVRRVATKLQALGGALTSEVSATPYGLLAAGMDATGAELRLRQATP
ncbi:MAG TPA: VOC family protein [Acidimicrobiales bacterium]|nr:VOC family protein [Acidimicrobiales bacterium]